MDAAVAALLVVLVAVAVLLFRGLRHHTGHRNHCPYPNPVLGNVVPFVRNFHRFLDWATDQLAAAPASTIEVRGALGLGNGVATADPGVVDHLLRAGFPNYVKGARGPFADLLGSGIFLADGRLWSLQRKLASYSLSSRSLRRFSGRVLSAHLHRRLLPLLAAAVDLQDVLKRFAFDNICGVAFGVEASTLLELGEEDGVGRGRRRRARCVLQGLRRRRRDLLRAHAPPDRRRVEVDAARWSRKREAAPRGHPRRRGDHGVGGAVARARRRAAPAVAVRGGDGGRRGERARRHVPVAGGEAPVPAGHRRQLRARREGLHVVRAHMVLLAPRRQPALRAARVRGGGGIARRKRIRRPQRLRRAQGDALPARGDHRGHAAVPAGAHQLAGDVLPDGTTVRAGWFSDYCAYAMGRMPRLWGDDCREFRPERWLDGGGEFVAVDAARYPVFHAGPRACLGKEMAYVQMKTVVAAVVRRFAVEPVRAARMEAPPPYEMAVTLRMKGGLPVRIRRRENDAGRH